MAEAPGGSLIHDRAIDAAIQQYVPNAENIRALRASTNTLGAGFVEAISGQTLIDIAKPSAPTALCEVEGCRRVTDNAPPQLYRPPIS